jgi:CRISPR-associated endoribonuclease Cas6
VRNKKYNGKGVQLKWDDDYAIKAFKQGKRLSKKVTINKDINNSVDIIGIFCPYTVEGDVELIELGYECGFGEKNSMGFGMVKAE